MRLTKLAPPALFILFALAMVAAWAQQPAPAAPAPKPALAPERFEGVFADSGGAIPRFQASFFILKVSQWSSDDEVRALALALKNGGQPALLEAFWKMKPKAYMTVRNSMGADMILVRSITLPSGERIVRAITNRRMAFAELGRATRSTDYPFGVIEIRFDAQGKGKGVCIASARISFAPDGNINIESFGTQPFQLMDVAFKPMKK